MPFFTPPQTEPIEYSEPPQSVIEDVLRLSREEAMAAEREEEAQLQEVLRLSAAEAEVREAGEKKLKRSGETREEQVEEERKRQRVDEAVQESKPSVKLSSKTSSSKLRSKPSSSAAKAKAMAPIFGSSSSSRVTAPTFPQGGPELSSTPPDVINLYDGSLDMLYVKGWIVPDARRQLFNWMLNELAWHRVTYKRPGGMTITTPRYTTTFGRDDTTAPLSSSVYPILPKPLPRPLDELRLQAERLTGAHFNTCIVNYYADGKDSISYHSDDERFLGDLPTIASISLGSTRDFHMRRKAPSGVAVPSALPTQKMGTKGSGPAAERPTEKYKLADGDLVVMRGRTQAEWEHAIPKRASAAGRINVTFRRVTSVEGTNNFQRYNRGDGPTLRWRGNRMVEGDGGL